MNTNGTTTTEFVAYSTAPCLRCGNTSTVLLPATAASAIANRRPVHEVLPEATLELRELLISGIHPECWDALFGALEDE